MQYIAPSLAFLLGVFRYHEPFTATHLVTFACIWLGVAIFALDGALAAKRSRLAGAG
ncbi:MAG: hypothetical protein ACYDA8_22870 [Deferrisomatales bacterium]